MKIRGMRWGYDGGGVACGPVEGSTIVEICVTNNEKNYFVVDSRMSEFERVWVSPVPLFDLLIESNHYDVNFEYEFEKVLKSAVEDYDYEIGNEPEEMKASDFAKVIRLARTAMEQNDCYGNDNLTNFKLAEEFIKEYVDGNFDETDIPEPYADFGEDDILDIMEFGTFSEEEIILRFRKLVLRVCSEEEYEEKYRKLLEDILHGTSDDIGVEGDDSDGTYIYHIINIEGKDMTIDFELRKYLESSDTEENAASEIGVYGYDFYIV